VFPPHVADGGEGVGACASTLMPLHELIKAHVFAAERIHGDDTTVPVLAKGKTRTGRIWTYVSLRPGAGDRRALLTSVNSILKNNLEAKRPAPAADGPPIAHSNIRGSRYFH
jgi:hypothetical protein